MATCDCPVLVGIGKSHTASCTILAPGESRHRCPDCGVMVKAADGHLFEHGKYSYSDGTIRCTGSAKAVTVDVG